MSEVNTRIQSCISCQNGFMLTVIPFSFVWEKNGASMNSILCSFSKDFLNLKMVPFPLPAFPFSLSQPFSLMHLSVLFFSLHSVKLVENLPCARNCAWSWWCRAEINIQKQTLPSRSFIRRKEDRQTLNKLSDFKIPSAVKKMRISKYLWDKSS